MTAGTDLAYRTDGLRDGAGSAQETADAADGLAGRAAGVVVDAVMFGDVEQAGPVGAALVAARDGWPRLPARCSGCTTTWLSGHAGPRLRVSI